MQGSHSTSALRVVSDVLFNKTAVHIGIQVRYNSNRFPDVLVELCIVTHNPKRYDLNIKNELGTSDSYRYSGGFEYISFVQDGHSASAV